MDSKNAARDYLLAAEKYIKDSLFDKALREVKKAQELDPSNIYTFAFLERIEFFRQQKAKENDFDAYPSPENGESMEKTGHESAESKVEIENNEDGVVPSETPGDNGTTEVPATVNEDEQQERAIIEMENSNNSEPDDSVPSIPEENNPSHDEPDKPVDLNSNEPLEESTTSDDEYDFGQDLNDRIEEIEKRLHGLTAVIEESGSQSSISLIAEKFEQLEAQISSFQNSLQVRQEQFESKNTGHEKIIELEEQLRKLQDDIEKKQHNIPEESGRVDTAELESKLNDFENRLRELDNVTDRHQVSAADYRTDSKLADLERRLNDLSVSIQAGQSRDEEFERMESTVENLKSKVENIDGSSTSEDDLKKYQQKIFDKIEEIERRFERYEIKPETAATGDFIEKDIFENETRILQTKLDELENALQAEQKFRNELTEKTHDRLSIAEKKKQETEDLRQQLLELEKKYQILHEESHKEKPYVPADLQEQLDKLKTEIEQSKAPVTEINERLENMDNVNTGLQSQLDNLKTEIDTSKAPVTEINERLEIVDNVNTGLQSQLDNLKTEIDTSKAPVTEINKRLENVDNVNNGLQSQLDNLKSEIDTSKAPVTEINERLENVDNVNNGLQSQLDNLKSEIDKLQAPLTKINERLENLAGTNEWIGQIALLKEQIGQLQPLPSRFDDLSETHRHLLTNYADLEQRLQEFISAFDSNHATRDELEGYNNVLQELRSRIDEISVSVIRENELHKTQSEILSLYTDLENRINELTGKNEGEYNEFKDSIGKNYDELNDNFTSLQKRIESFGELQADRDEFETRISCIEVTLKNLTAAFEGEKTARKKSPDLSASIDTIYQQIEEILETLHFEKELRSKQNEFENRLSDISHKVDSIAESFKGITQNNKHINESDDKVLALLQRFENEQRLYQTKLEEMAELIEKLKDKIQADQQERENIKNRQIEAGKKHFRTVLEKAWEHGMPVGEHAAGLRNLIDLFAIPEPVEKQMVRDVKLKMYSSAVKKAIAEKKVSRKDALSLDKLRKQYDVSLEEYMEYESKFLDDLVSAQFQGTILLVSADEVSRNETSDRLKSVGFAVVNSSDPEKALEKLEIINPHAIVSDMEFPGCERNGMNIVNVIRRNAKFNFIPFIMLAGDEEYDQAEETLTRPNEIVLRRSAEFYTLLSTINDQLKKLREHLSSQTL